MIETELITPDPQISAKSRHGIPNRGKFENLLSFFLVDSLQSDLSAEIQVKNLKNRHNFSASLCILFKKFLSRYILSLFNGICW